MLSQVILGQHCEVLLLIAIWHSEEPEAQGDLMLCPRSHSLEVTELGFIL